MVSTVVGRKGIQLPASSADVPTVQEAGASRASGLRHWGRLTAAMTAPLAMGEQDAAAPPASVSFGQVIAPVRQLMTGQGTTLLRATSPMANIDGAIADERKNIQPAAPTDQAELGHWSGDFGAGFGLAFAAGRGLPDVLAAISTTSGEFDAVTERQTSVLIDAMAAFGAGARAVETHAPAAQRVMLEHITMPALRA